MKELAAKLNGREYGDEITEDEAREAKLDNLVVLFGYSDDNAEFRGAIDDEVGCNDGGTLYVHRHGALSLSFDSCEACRDRSRKQCATIEAIWDQGGYAWTYQTSIPHETFEIVEGGMKFCRGIVFSVTSLPTLQP